MINFNHWEESNNHDESKNPVMWGIVKEMPLNVSHECDGYNAYDEQMQMQMMCNSKSELKNGRDSTKKLP